MTETTKLPSKVLDLLECLVDSETCWYDHHGGCQAHGYLSLRAGEMCPQAELKELLKEQRPSKDFDATEFTVLCDITDEDMMDDFVNELQGIFDKFNDDKGVDLGTPVISARKIRLDDD
jgi:hypothetical protein